MFVGICLVIITARNEVGQGYVFTCVCDSVHRVGGIPVCLAAGGYPSMHCIWYPSMPCSRGGLQAHTQGESCGVWPGQGSPGPHPRGLQVHIWGGESPGPHLGRSPGPYLGGILACTEAHPPPMATAAGSTHPTEMHSC